MPPPPLCIDRTSERNCSRDTAKKTSTEKLKMANIGVSKSASCTPEKRKEEKKKEEKDKERRKRS